MSFARRPRGPLLALLSGPRRGACARTMPPPRRFALELPGCTLAHFAVGTDDPGAPPDPRVAELLRPPGRSYSLCVPVAPGGDCAARVRAARLHQRLLQQLHGGPLGRCELRRLLCYSPGGGAGDLQHGVLLHDPGDSPDTRRALLALLDLHLEAPRPRLVEFKSDGNDRLWQRPWELRDGQGWRQVDPEPIVFAPEPALHPVVPDLPSSGVFPNRDAARAVLEAVRATSLPSAQGGPSRSKKCTKHGGGGCLSRFLLPGSLFYPGVHIGS